MRLELTTFTLFKVFRLTYALDYQDDCTLSCTAETPPDREEERMPYGGDDATYCWSGSPRLCSWAFDWGIG